jgi:hypothetical protein
MALKILKTLEDWRLTICKSATFKHFDLLENIRINAESFLSYLKAFQIHQKGKNWPVLSFLRALELGFLKKAVLKLALGSKLYVVAEGRR